MTSPAFRRRKKKQVSGRRFIQLWTNVKRSAAYHSCNVYARAALVELLDRYTGINNGMISMSAREMAVLLGCAISTANKALNDLDDSGLARPVVIGRWRGKLATTWRLTFYRCDATGELPITDWKPAVLGSAGDTQKPPGVRVVTHTSSRGDTQAASKRVLRSSSDTLKRKNSTNGCAMRSRGSTPIDLHQVGELSPEQYLDTSRQSSAGRHNCEGGAQGCQPGER